MKTNPFFVNEIEQLYAVRAGNTGIPLIPVDLPNNEHCEIELPEIENADVMLEDPSIIQPPQLVHGVLHQGLKGLIASSSKARKTWILLDMAASVASGTKWLNWDTTQGRVLVVNFEIPKYFIVSRIRAIREEKGLGKLPLLDVWTLRGKAGAISHLVKLMIGRIAEWNYALIIIDPIYKGLGNFDENKAGDIGQLCNELERLAVRTGAAVVYAHHYSKGNQVNKDPIDRVGGSGVFTRDADSIITLTRHKEDNAFTVDLTLRNLPEQPSFVVQWNYPLMVVRNDLKPEDLKSKNNKTHDPEDVLALLDEKPLRTGEWKQLALELLDVSNSTFKRMHKEFKEKKLIVQTEGNATWQRAVRSQDET